MIYKFEQKKWRRKYLLKQFAYWLINYIPEPIRKAAGDFKDKVVDYFKTNTPEDYGQQIMYCWWKRPRKPKSQKRSEENLIKKHQKFFKLKKENELIKDNYRH